MTLQLRRDTAANWTSANPVLASGQPGYETDTRKLKVGDGATAWNALAYFSGGGTNQYLHTQGSSATTWTVNHNFGRKPLVQVFSPGWVEVDATVLHTSDNQVTVQFNVAQTGFAVCQ